LSSASQLTGNVLFCLSFLSNIGNEIDIGFTPLDDDRDCVVDIKLGFSPTELDGFDCCNSVDCDDVSSESGDEDEENGGGDD